MTNSYINPTQPTASEPRYSQDAPAWQDVEIVDVPAVEEPDSAEGAPEPVSYTHLTLPTTSRV